MNYRKTLRIFFMYLVISFVAILLIGGCSKNNDESSAKKPGAKMKESKTLNEMQQGIEKLVKEFEKTFLMQTAPPPKFDQEQQKPKESDKPQDKSEKKQGEEKQGQEAQQGAKEQQQSSQKPPEPDWASLEKGITQIHTKWNSFQSEAMEKGISEKKVRDFSDKLNELTMTLTRKQLYSGLLAANDLYEKTSSFEELYEPKVPPDFKKVLYFIRKATYNSLQNEPHEATQAVLNAQEIWENVKPKVKERKEASKAEFAIKELDQAIKEKDPNLIKIKFRIAEKSIQDVMKSMEK